MTNPIVFLDTETTSLAPDRQIWEVAMIRRHDGELKATSFFVGPIDLRHADPFALKLTRFYDRHPDFRPDQGYGLANARGRRVFHDLETFEAELTNPSPIGQPFYAGPRAAAEVVFHWTRDATIVGAVPNFDTEGLDHMMRHQGLQPAWHYHLIDVETLTVGWLAGRDDEWLTHPWKSDELSSQVGVQPPNEGERHTALGDALWVERWWNQLVMLTGSGDIDRSFRAAEAVGREGR